MITKLTILLILPLLLVPIYAQETSTEIPSWVKGVANFWVEGNMDDNEFGEAITFLIEQEIIEIDSTPVQPTQLLTDDSKRLYEVEADLRDEEIRELQRQVGELTTTNAELQDTVTDQIIELFEKQEEVDNIQYEYKQYIRDHPNKVQNIGDR